MKTTTTDPANPRSIPKRTHTSAGLGDDTWDATSASNNNENTTTFPCPPQYFGASRKRHHSLPGGSLIPPSFDDYGLFSTPSSGNNGNPTATRRPNFASGFPSSSLSVSTDLSQSETAPIGHTQQSVPQSCPTNGSGLQTQLPEMSPREDFLVRAFVSNAMKLHHPHEQDGGSTPTNQSEEDREDPNEPSSESDTRSSISTPAQSPHPIKWSRDEDERLREVVTRFGGKNWKLIAETVGQGRTDVQCLHRWNKVLKPGLVKGPWSPEEDRILLELIARYGVGKIRWCDIALHLPGRIGKQCRERWCNHLDSSIRKGLWTPEEDEIVFQWQQKLGNKWSEIAKMLPGRTENAVKNRFNSAARRKWMMTQAIQAKTNEKNTTISPSPATSQSKKEAPIISKMKPSNPSKTPLTMNMPRHLARRKSEHMLHSGTLLAGPPRPIIGFNRDPFRPRGPSLEQDAPAPIQSSNARLGLSLSPFTMSHDHSPFVAVPHMHSPIVYGTLQHQDTSHACNYSPFSSSSMNSTTSSPLSLSPSSSMLWPSKEPESNTYTPDNQTNEDQDKSHRRMIKQDDGILPLMDVDHMNTFLDSVALDMDEMME